MIVKKMPISPYFPGGEDVKILSKFVPPNSEYSPFFYDIETTGLSRTSSFLYLIGAAAAENSNWFLYQWLAENRGEEPALLKAFSEFMSRFTCAVHYNGDSFDRPFLEARCALHGLPSPFDGLSSVDLYRLLKPCGPLFALPHMRQTDLEGFLGLPSRIYADGGACIRLYRQYEKNHSEQYREAVLGHNREDLAGLGAILPALHYLCLYRGEYQAVNAELDERQLLIGLQLPSRLPAALSAGNTEFYLKAEEMSARLLIPLKEGRIRRYYDNYKDYDYLPSEDTAIHKSLSRYMDRSLRKAARPETCYTWFLPGQAFLQDAGLLTDHVRRTLPHLLKSL